MTVGGVRQFYYRPTQSELILSHAVELFFDSGDQVSLSIMSPRLQPWHFSVARGLLNTSSGGKLSCRNEVGTSIGDLILKLTEKSWMRICIC